MRGASGQLAGDDGGFSGGSLDRPALQKLLEHIEARQVDCVMVYKVDRLSRSLLDFARLMRSQVGCRRTTSSSSRT